jgi:hypothetical protein
MPVFDLFIQDYDIKNEETIFARFLIVLVDQSQIW